MLRFVMLLMLSVLMIPVAGAQDVSRPELGTVEQVTLEGEARAYVLYTPPTLDAGDPAPLWVGLHGRMSSARAFEVESELNRLADQVGARVVYPQAQMLNWDDGARDAGLPREDEGPRSADDVAMVNAVIDAVAEASGVSELWFMGFDTGGLMGLRMLCERPEATGAVVVGALPWNYLSRNCEGTSAQRVLFIHGNGDEIYPAGGQTSEFMMADGTPLRRMDRGETVAYFANRAGCAQTELVREGSVLQAVGCDTVLLIGVSGASHEWFGAPTETQPVSGVDSLDLISAWLNGESITLDNQPAERLPRTHVLYLPMSYDGSTALPLVVALHGRPDTGAGIASITDLGALAEEEGFAAVFPDGALNQWNYLGAYIDAEAYRIPDDVAYLEGLPGVIAQAASIDLTRVYLTGFSNGGFMTYRIACEVSHPYSGFAVVGAQMYPEFENLCNASRPVPMLIMHGTEDISISFSGIIHSTPDQRQVFSSRSTVQSAAFWASHNRCDLEAATREDFALMEDTGTQVVRFDFVGCAKDASVRLFVIVNGGHAWPGVNRVPAEIAGNVAMDIEASREIWGFLSGYARDDL